MVVHRFAGGDLRRGRVRQGAGMGRDGSGTRRGASALVVRVSAVSAARVDVSGLPALRELPPPLRDVMIRQDGVVTTAQLGAGGVGRATVARRVARGHWQRLAHGVVVLQSGAPTWRQVARAALLAAGPGAALSHASAAFVHGLADRPGRGLVVSVPAARFVEAPPGVTVRRRRTMPRAAGSLRCVDVADTVLDLLHETPDVDAAVALLCEAVRRRVPAVRVVGAAEGRRRLRHRRLLLDVLGDPDGRVESPLELRYDRDVERAHGLPRSCGQVVTRVVSGRIRSDRVFDRYGVRVELDGRLHVADDDAWRDNAVRVEHGDVTLRYRWRHVAGSPCRTAAQLAQALAARGWHADPMVCSPGCAVDARAVRHVNVQGSLR